MTYQTVNRIFTQSHADLSAAEAHGVAAGMLCINEQMGSERWLSELFSDSIPEEQRQLLIPLFQKTAELLAGEDFEFDLFLPDDNTPLTERALALSNWCQGFLYGIGTLGSGLSWSTEATEILRDIAEFTKMETAVEGEEDEAAWVEIVEYLRSAVFLLRDEIKSRTASRIVH